MTDVRTGSEHWAIVLMNDREVDASGRRSCCRAGPTGDRQGVATGRSRETVNSNVIHAWRRARDHGRVIAVSKAGNRAGRRKDEDIEISRQATEGRL